LWPPQFHYHFVGFLVPFLAMTLALTASRLLEAAGTANVAPPGRGPGRPAVLTWGVVALVTIGIVLGTGLEVHTVSQSHQSAGSPRLRAVSKVIPPGACVLTDQVSFLISINRFVTHAPGCPVIDDGAGVNYALAHGLGAMTGAGEVPAVAAEWHSAFAHSQWVLLTYLAIHRIAWTPQLKDYFHTHFTQVRIRNRALRLYKRTS
jgi:hypothetical protein